MSDTAAVVEQKRKMRASAKQTRAAAYSRIGASAAQKIAAHGIGFTGAASGALVSGFSAIGDEIDPLPLMTKLGEQGFELCLPVMQGRGEALIFRRWAPGDATAETIWGIREPLANAPEVEPDVVLAALLLFDAQGYRLGYGGGHYDRTLRALSEKKAIVSVGLAYDEQKVDSVPHLDYDVPLDWILTPSGALDCRGRNEAPE
jgi:5-formyltetrahydrofolate cyclo-ligase